MLLFSLLWTLATILAEGPKLEDLVKIKCTGEKPYICLPYGYCCRGDEYCRQGTCLSCFPANLSESDLLPWCRDIGQHNVTTMRDAASCRLACYFRFNASEMQTCGDRWSLSCPKQCPSGYCCQEHQFCSDDQCQSCFPDNLSEYDLATWCREMVNNKNATWRHTSCRYACYARFTPAQISATNDNMNHWILGFIIVCVILAVLIFIQAIRPIKKKMFQILSKFSSSRSPEKRKNESLVPVVVIEDKSVPDIETPFLNGDNEPTVNRKLERSLSSEERRQDNRTRHPD